MFVLLNDLSWWGNYSKKGFNLNIFAEHCPNFTLFFMHPHRQVVLNVCGTEQTSLQDILMDVAADSAEFLEGHAHGAMLKGAKNILKKVLHLILKGRLV